jgi:hypothetical protein
MPFFIHNLAFTQLIYFVFISLSPTKKEQPAQFAQRILSNLHKPVGKCGIVQLNCIYHSADKVGRCRSVRVAQR